MRTGVHKDCGWCYDISTTACPGSSAPPTCVEVAVLQQLPQRALQGQGQSQQQREHRLFWVTPKTEHAGSYSSTWTLKVKVETGCSIIGLARTPVKLSSSAICAQCCTPGAAVSPPLTSMPTSTKSTMSSPASSMAGCSSSSSSTTMLCQQQCAPLQKASGTQASTRACTVQSRPMHLYQALAAARPQEQ